MATTELEELGISHGDKKPGRPRCQEAHRKILEAALFEVGEHGYEALSMEAIAHRAHVSKATVYRRWGSKAELMLDAMQHAGCGAFCTTGTGSLRGDLEKQMSALVRFLNGPEGRTVRAVIAAVQSDEDLAERFRESWTMKRQLVFEGVFAEAVERGELAADTDFELLIDLVWGPIYYRFVSSFELIEQCLVGRVLDKVLPVFVR
ncbi:MAG: TetR/AcrR family transcriptional regulator [Fimbriimonadaceae bacterium]